MTEHRACHGCIDGCTRESAVHCVSCVHEAWPCDATVRGDLLLAAAGEVHYHRKHPPYGSSFLDCDREPCTRYRAAIGYEPEPRAALQYEVP